MIVSCPTCSKKYKLDDAKIREGGVKVKCTKCETVFAVRPQASARLFTVRKADGTELGPLALTELILKIQMGQVSPDDEVAGTGESYVSATDHPDLEGVKFKAPKALAVPAKEEDDDLFGGGSAGDEDDLFGSGEEGASSTDEDDLFGTGSSSSAGDEDDLFGGSSRASADSSDDMFGESGSGSSDDDLFGGSGNSSDESDLFGGPSSSASSAATDDNDLFAAGGGDDDLFGDGGADDDMFADKAPAPNKSAKAKTEPAPSDDLFAADDDDDLFSDGEKKEPESADFGNASDENLFGGDEQEEENNFRDDGFVTDNTGDSYSYEEDIESKVAENPLQGSSPSLFSEQMMVEEGIEDLITAPLDLPDMKRSRKPLWIAIIVVFLIGSTVAGLFLAPEALVSIPGLGTGIEALHRTMGTRWYNEKQSIRMVAKLQAITPGFNLAEIKQALDYALSENKVLTFSRPAQEIVGLYILATELSHTRLHQDVLNDYSVLTGLPGAILRMIDNPAVVPVAPDSWQNFLGTYADILKDNIDGALERLVSTEYPEALHFLALLLAAQVYADIGNPLGAVKQLESASTVYPENLFSRFQMAVLLYDKLDHKTQAGKILDDIPLEKASPWLQSRLQMMRSRIERDNENFELALELASQAINLDNDNADAVALKVNLMNRTGKAIDSLLLLSNYIVRFPENYELRLQEGIAKEMLGRQQEALQVYVETEALAQGRLEATLHRAALLAEMGEMQDAFSLIENLELRYPDDTGVMLGKGSLYLEKKEFVKAKAILKRVLEKAPNLVDAVLAMGKLDMATANLADAEESFVRANQLDPVHRAGRLELGQVYLERDKLEKAEQIFNDLLEANPQNGDVLLALGKIAYKRKQFKDTIEFVNEALKHQSSLHEGYFYLALAERGKGDFDQAILDLKKAISLKGAVPYQLALAHMYTDSGKPGMAVDVFREILADEPDNRDALWGSVRLHMATGNDQSAEKDLQVLQNIDNRNPELYLSFAELSLRTNNLDKAAKMAAQGLRISPDNIPLLQVAGKIALTSGSYPAAWRYIAAAVQKDPRNGYSHLLLGFYYKEAVGKVDRAQIEFEKAVRLGLPEDRKAVAEGELEALKYR